MMRQLAILLALLSLSLPAAPLLTIAGDQLPTAVKIIGGRELLPHPTGMAVDAPGPNVTGFYQGHAPVDAKALAQIEITVAAEAPGYFQFLMQFRDATGTPRNTSYHPFSVIPDGKPRTYIVPIHELKEQSDESLTSWTLKWIGEPTRILLDCVEFLPEPNLIPNASHLAPGQEQRLITLRPNGKYRLTWHGEKSSGVNLQFFGQDLTKLDNFSVSLPKDSRALEFTAPEMLLEAAITLDGQGKGYPILECLDYHFPFSTFKHCRWRCQWIWSQLELGPDDTNVWFLKEFDLPEDIPVEYAAIAYLADDEATIFVNGVECSYSNIWYLPTYQEITNLLHPGRNRLTVRVYNGTQNAGLAADVVLQTADGLQFLDTDATWRCEAKCNSLEEPALIDTPVVLLGGKPDDLLPWCNNIGYRYAGKRGKLELLSSNPGELRVRILELPPIPLELMHFRIVPTDGGAPREVKYAVSCEGEWRTGAELTIHYPLPYLSNGEADFWLVEDIAALLPHQPLAHLQAKPNLKPGLATAKLQGGGRPRLLLNGKPYDPVFWHGNYTFRTGRFFELQRAAEAGVTNYRVPVRFVDFWKGEGQYDFSQFDQWMELLFTYCPNAVTGLQVYAFMPDWWLKANPDEVSAHDGDAKRNTSQEYQSLASRKWLEDAKAPIAALIDHIAEAPYADRVWGMSFCENGNGEWFWSNQALGGGPHDWAGYAPCDLAHFRDHLRAKYATDAALQKAWHDPLVTFDTAKLPPHGSEKHSSIGVLLDPAIDQNIIDWYDFRNAALANAICTMGAFVKEKTQGKWLFGAYYGYANELPCNASLPIQMTGHGGFPEVAASPFVDFVHAPARYLLRGTGKSDSIMQPWTTFELHDTQVYIEQDLRLPYIPRLSDSLRTYCGMGDAAREGQGQMDRCLGVMLATGAINYWFDIQQGSFYERVFSSRMKTHADVLKDLPPVQGLTPVETAIVIDRDSLYLTRANDANGIYEAAVDGTYKRFNELAVPFDSLAVSDLLDPNITVPPHKFYVMLPTLVLSQEQRKALMERFEREKATVVWLYTAGAAYQGQTPTTAANADFLGITTKLDAALQCPTMTVSPEYGGPFICRNQVESAPWFRPVAGFDETVGTDDAGNPLMVGKALGDARHYYSTLMNLPPEVYAPLLDKAGVRRYHLGLKDPVWVGNDVLFLHAATGGIKTLRLPPGCQAKAIIGPFKGILQDGASFEAEPALTYGFLLERLPEIH